MSNSKMLLPEVKQAIEQAIINVRNEVKIMQAENWAIRDRYICCFPSSMTTVYLDENEKTRMKKPQIGTLAANAQTFGILTATKICKLLKNGNGESPEMFTMGEFRLLYKQWVEKTTQDMETLLF